MTESESTSQNKPIELSANEDSFHPLEDNAHSKFSFIAASALFILLGSYHGIEGRNPLETDWLIIAKFLELYLGAQLIQFLIFSGYNLVTGKETSKRKNTRVIYHKDLQ